LRGINEWRAYIRWRQALHETPPPSLLRVFALGALLWLGFLVVIGLGDRATRRLP
jgi:hypothetical protein